MANNTSKSCNDFIKLLTSQLAAIVTMLIKLKEAINTQLLFAYIFTSDDFKPYQCLTQISNNIEHSLSESENFYNYVLSPDKNFSAEDVTVWDQCPCILISADNPKATFDKHEEFIKLHATGMEDRRYIIRFKLNQHEHGQFEQFFESFYLYFVADLLVIKEYEDKCELYTHKYVGRENHSQAELINVWFANNTFQFNQTEKDKSLFPKKLRNVFGRILNIGAARYVPLSDPVTMKGMETQFLLEFTSRFNYTLNFDKREVRLGLLFPNKSATGFTKLMIQDKIDLVSYGLYIQDARRTFGEFSIPTAEISLTCMVPKPRLINEWMVVYIFTYDTWLIIIFSYFVLVMIFNLILKRHRNLFLEEDDTSDSDDSFAFTYFMVFRIFIGQPKQSFMKNKDRLLLGTFLCCVIIIQTYFTSKLASFNTVPWYKDAINTLDDLAKSGIPWYTKYYDEIKSMETVKTEPLATLYQTFRNATPEETEELMHAKGPKRFGYAINQSFNSKYYTIFDYFTLDNLQYFKMVKDHLIRHQYTAFFVRRNSVLLPSINQYWSIVSQHGFPIRWEIDTIEGIEGKIQQYLWMSDKGSANAQKLKMRDFEGIFIICMVGYGISAIVLISEILIHKLFRYNK